MDKTTQTMDWHPDEKEPAAAKPPALDALLHRVLAGLEVLLVEPERAQEIARDLHDDVAAASCWAPALTEHPAPADRLAIIEEQVAALSDRGVESAQGWLVMKTVADLEALAAALDARVTRRLTGSLKVEHGAKVGGLTLSIYTPATAEDIAALLPAAARAA